MNNSSAYLTGLAVLITCGMAPGVHAASFDCIRAHSRIDRRICASEEVSALDTEMSGDYRAALSNPLDAEIVKSAQIDWLKVRNRCLEETCLIALYQSRIDALKGEPGNDIAFIKYFDVGALIRRYRI